MGVARSVDEGAGDSGVTEDAARGVEGPGGNGIAENVENTVRGVEGAAGIASEDDGVGTRSSLAGWRVRGLGLGRSAVMC